MNHSLDDRIGLVGATPDCATASATPPCRYNTRKPRGRRSGAARSGAPAGASNGSGPASLLQVALNLGLGAGLGLVRVLAVLPLRAALAEEVPALVEGGLELVHPGALRVGVVGAVAELVLLLHQGGDAAQDVLLVHAGSRARPGGAETDGALKRPRAPSPRGRRPAGWSPRRQSARGRGGRCGPAEPGPGGAPSSWCAPRARRPPAPATGGSAAAA